MKSGEMKHDMTIYGHKGTVCLEQNISIGNNRNILSETHLLFVTIYMVLWYCSHPSTQNDTDHLECFNAYMTSLYLVM